MKPGKMGKPDGRVKGLEVWPAPHPVSAPEPL
jgi:hypothetical protein